MPRGHLRVTLERYTYLCERGGSEGVNGR